MERGHAGSPRLSSQPLELLFGGRGIRTARWPRDALEAFVVVVWKAFLHDLRVLLVVPGGLGSVPSLLMAWVCFARSSGIEQFCLELQGGCGWQDL